MYFILQCILTYVKRSAFFFMFLNLLLLCHPIHFSSEFLGAGVKSSDQSQHELWQDEYLEMS
jgi:hypothetical protein